MKSYPRSRFEIVNNTSIEEISTNVVSGTTAIMMAAYTSDKGSEDWELLYGLTDFTTRKGGLNFTKHGQGQFTVANLLKSGSYVLAKRMVSDDATLGNVTIRAKIVNVDNINYLYLYGTSAKDIKTFEDACKIGYNNFNSELDPIESIVIFDPDNKTVTTVDANGISSLNDDDTTGGGTTSPDAGTTTPDSGNTGADSGTTTPDSGNTGTGSDAGTTTPDAGGSTTTPDSGNTGTGSGTTTPDPNQKTLKIYDIPLFTVTAVGRGVSNLTIRLIPEYYASRSGKYMKYTFEVSENATAIESITCTFNPDAIIDGVIQSIENKVNKTSGQVKARIYEDGILKLTQVIAKTAKQEQQKITIDEQGHKVSVSETVSIPVSELINLDYINGYDKKENAISGIVTKNMVDAGNDPDNLWNAFKPEGTEAFTLNVAAGIKLSNGTNGKMGDAPVQNAEEYKKMLLGTFGKDQSNNNFDPIIYDLDRYKLDAIFDCHYDIEVKNAIIDLADFRGDLVFLADLGLEMHNIDDILDAAYQITKSKYVAIYHNSFKIIDEFTKKEIEVTMPYLLAPKLVNHISTGVGKPFAGIANNITFPEIIEKSINFMPVVIPGLDQKQILADHNINYISYYDDLPVMEAMWTNDDAYTQLSFLHNVMAVQEIIKIIRTRCPKTRYTFLDGDDLENYLSDCNSIIKEYKTNFKSISMTYMADEKYESNNIFYAVIKVQFRNFVNEEYFKVICID